MKSDRRKRERLQEVSLEYSRIVEEIPLATTAKSVRQDSTVIPYVEFLATLVPVLGQTIRSPTPANSEVTITQNTCVVTVRKATPEYAAKCTSERCSAFSLHTHV